MLTCAECGSPMTLRKSRYGQFYGCTQFPKCKGAHGAHPDGKPMGTPADRETKEARIRAHAAFDGMWRDLGWHRKDAYRWLVRVMETAKDKGHISMFDKAQCERLIVLVQEERARV